MSAPNAFLRWVRDGFLKATAKAGASFVLGGTFVFDVAESVFQDAKAQKKENEILGIAQELISASEDERQEWISLLVAEMSASLRQEIRQVMAAYLSLVPACSLRSMQRPADPTGMAIPPDLVLRQPEDLVPFLPPLTPAAASSRDCTPSLKTGRGC